MIRETEGWHGKGYLESCTQKSHSDWETMSNSLTISYNPGNPMSIKWIEHDTFSSLFHFCLQLKQIWICILINFNFNFIEPRAKMFFDPSESWATNTNPHYSLLQFWGKFVRQLIDTAMGNQWLDGWSTFQTNFSCLKLAFLSVSVTVVT